MQNKIIASVWLQCNWGPLFDTVYMFLSTRLRAILWLFLSFLLLGSYFCMYSIDSFVIYIICTHIKTSPWGRVVYVWGVGGSLTFYIWGSEQLGEPRRGGEGDTEGGRSKDRVEDRKSWVQGRGWGGETEGRGDFFRGVFYILSPDGPEGRQAPRRRSSTGPIRPPHTHWCVCALTWSPAWVYSHAFMHFEERKCFVFFPFFLRFCCLCVFCLSDCPQCLFLCLPLGSVLFLYLTAAGLICHRRGYTGGSVCTKHIIIRAWLLRSSIPLRLSLFVLLPMGKKTPQKNACTERDFLQLVSAPDEEPHIETKT